VSDVNATVAAKTGQNAQRSQQAACSHARRHKARAASMCSRAANGKAADGLVHAHSRDR